MLSADFPAVTALRIQAATAHAGASSCDCGCPSIYLEIDRSLPRAPTIDRVPVEARCDEWEGVPVAVLLHVLHGYLHEIEAVPFGEPPESKWMWPPLESLRLRSSADQPNVNE